MKLSLNWVDELLGRKLEKSPEEISALLLNLGFEVSSVETFSPCAGIKVSQILEIKKHPNADRLKIVRVTDGKESLEVVCGASNIVPGQKVLWAKVGSVLPGGEKIVETAIRGVKSPGMLCSQRELGIGDDHSGIWVLEPDAPLGTGLEELFRAEDTVLDVEVTPNRPDCLSVTGLLRELSCALDLGFAVELPSPPSGLRKFPVEIQAVEDCYCYIARAFEDVAVHQSALRIQVALSRCGIRPINNIVDVTNFVLLETGQPLHAFDLDKLVGGIVVRRAREGEKIHALDGKVYSLDPGILVISDEKKTVAVAGIMGGEETAVTSATKNVLLESAVFNPGIIRHGRKKLGLASESSYRFERGVMLWGSRAGSSKAHVLIEKNAGGKIGAYAEELSNKMPRLGDAGRSTTVRARKAGELLGEKVLFEEMELLFKKMGAAVLSSNEEAVEVLCPPWRLDLNLEIDYVEEIARLRGYEKLPSSPLKQLSDPALPCSIKARLRSLLNSLGFYEVCNYGFISKKEAGLLFLRDRFIELENPLSEEQSVLRPSLLPELLKNLKSNLSYGKKELRLFETGTCFKKSGGECAEGLYLSGAACGSVSPQTWQYKDVHPLEFYWIQGVMEKVLGSSGKCEWSRGSSKDSYPAGAFLRPGKFSEVIFRGKGSGFYGVVHPKAAKFYDLPENTVVFEINIEELGKVLKAEKMGGKLQSVASILRTPSVRRDTAVWLAEDSSWEEVSGEAGKSAGTLLVKCELFDVFRDPDKRPGQKSISFTCTFRHPSQTLTDEEANRLRDAIVARLGKVFHAEQRNKGN